MDIQVLSDVVPLKLLVKGRVRYIRLYEGVESHRTWVYVLFGMALKEMKRGRGMMKRVGLKGLRCSYCD